MAQAGTVWVDVRGDTTPMLRDIETAARGAGRSLSGALGAGAKTVVSDIGTAAGVAAIGIGAIGGAAVKASTEFNKSMSGVSAVAGATAGEMAQLREAALKAGADTVFSASEAATAQGELAKAGVSVADILGGALAGSLGLAAAGQLDLGAAAEISAQALNIFGLSGDQTTRVADVLAAGANKSAADVTQLGDALRQGGLLAAQTGLSLEETTGVLSLFADNALIGSDAGTSLKTMLQRLAPTSGPAADAMEELGLKFFDAKGQFVGIEEVAGQLQERLGGLSDEQRQTALTTIFGSDAVRGASILMEGGAAAVQEYTAAVSDQGAASRMAAEQLNNLAGDIEQFKGSVETSLIRIGDLFDGVNRNIVQSGTEVVNVFNDFASTPTWGAIQRNIDELASKGGDRLKGFADSLSGILDSISPADVDRFFGRIETGFEKVSDAAEGLEPVIVGVGTALSTMALRSVPFIGQLVPAISPLTGLLGGLVLGSEAGRDALAELGDRAGELASGVGVDLLRSLSELSGELSGALASALSDVGDAVFDAAEALGPALVGAIDELGPAIGDLITAGGELVGDVLPILADLAGTVIPPAVDVLATGLGLAADATEILADNLWLLVPAFAAFTAVKYGDQIGKIGSALKGVGDNALFLRDSIGQIAAERGVSKLEALRGVAGSTSGEMGGLVSSIGGLNLALVGITGALTVGTGIYEAWARNVNRVKQETEELTASLLDQGDDVLPGLARSFNNILDTRDGFDVAFQKTGQSVAGVTSLVNDNVGAFHEFREEFRRTGETAGDFEQGLGKIPDAISPFITTLFDLNAAGSLTDDELRSVIDAITDLDDQAIGTAKSIDFYGEQLEGLIPKAQLTADVLKDLATAQDDNAPLDARRDALQRLTTQFPELAASAGIAMGEISDSVDGITGSAQKAVDQLRALSGELDKLSGAARNIDEAQRDFNDSINRVLESVAQNGDGIDANTEAGRRNADSVQGMVEAGERLAESYAQTDRTGQFARKAYEGIADQLSKLRDAGVLTEEEYQRLLDLYDLTPTDIETRVTADIATATANIDSIKEQILAVPGISEPQAAALFAEVEAGNIAGVKAIIDGLAAARTAEITAEADAAALATAEAKLLALPGVTEPEKSKIQAELDAGNIAGVNALLDSLARDRNAVIKVVIDQAPTDRKNILGNFGNAYRPDQIAASAANLPKEIQTQVGLALKQGRAGDAANLVNLWNEDAADGNITNSLLVAFGLGGRRAGGGPVWPGTWLVGEKGPEILDIPQGVAGNVVPNDQIGTYLGGPMVDQKAQGGSEFADAMLGQLVAEMRQTNRLLAGLGGTQIAVNVENGMKATAKERARALR